jgi:hypothetical protein
MLRGAVPARAGGPNAPRKPGLDDNRPASRIPDWPERLAALFDGARTRPFAWGEHDCVTFAADAVLAVTGWDPARTERGAWRNAREALRLMRAIAGSSAPDATAARRLGPGREPRRARRGDVVAIVDGRGRGALAICDGAVALAPGPRGLTRIGMDRWTRCFPIGWGD